jgi:hypothetical protein
MLELGLSGSVRGVPSNEHPYRDPRPEAVAPAKRRLRALTPLRDLRGQLGDWLSWGGLETSYCLRSGSWPPRDDGQIRMSVCRAGALHNVECRDRTAKTPQL